ncbi:N-acetylmuramic acid 6-phosphate etherase MurQ [Penicillium odoratum]|uniref:N-acetylmuramic acid 6-phosphate etherase MurQ n=1 Tax=Penicillium odoratum TaxID=1167516 RepID=UPI002547D4DB|nr:N-acetylmuramic acid 6-phosphate etherase MurQ [Penicillium odoratum]KAJ5777626.1 N-acetylmuramic acid 6-phosphate etherase MurQ [Penicillium odoratum]
MVLNMLSTGTMIRTGKTYGNMMVDMVASNLKLEQRARNILRQTSGRCNMLSESELDSLLVKCNHSVKLAILVAETDDTVESCQQALVSAGGVLAKVLTKPCPPTQISSPESRRFSLCIDGGGTKCAAVVADKNGVSHGFAGPCNLTDIVSNVDIFMSTIIAATRDALEKHMPVGTQLNDTSWRDYFKDSFRSVWIGLAGMDRSGLRGILAPKLGELFGLDHTTIAFKLTNDVSLLTAAVAADQDKPSMIAVIAGTGSVAIRYNWTENQGYTCVARAGGWGHLLGDEGGGYSIGLGAIKHTLEVLEQRSLGLGPKELGDFEHAVIERLGGQVQGNNNFDLLSEILSQNHAQRLKSRIASVAETVLKLRDSTAMAIVNEKVCSIIRKPLRCLVDPRSSGYFSTNDTKLVLAGGLMKDETYQNFMRQQLAQEGLHFREIRVVEDVAVTAVRYLISKWAE